MTGYMADQEVETAWLFLPAGIDYGLMLGQIHALKAHRTTGMANELKEARLRSLNRHGASIAARRSQQISIASVTAAAERMKPNHQIVEENDVTNRQRKVVNYLKELRKQAKKQDILKATGIDPTEPDLLEILQKNEKIEVEEVLGVRPRMFMFSYITPYDIRTTESMLELIQQHEDGLNIRRLQESYKNAISDIKKLQKARHVLVNANRDSKNSVVYPNTKRLDAAIDNRIQKQWMAFSDELNGNEETLQRNMDKAGLPRMQQDVIKVTKTTVNPTDQPRKKRKRTLHLDPELAATLQHVSQSQQTKS